MALTAQPGEIIDARYQVVRLMGQGAMADVYAVVDRHTGGNVALKVLRRSVARSSDAVARFHREARAQEQISHPNVARIYGDGMLENQPYLVLELLSGRSLRDVTKHEGRISLLRAASYMWQALQGLEAAHSSGIVHRDLKPANLMLEPGPGPVERLVLIDFGFAALAGATIVTQDGEVVGSLSYLAPERLRGKRGDPRSDLYSLGIIFYELIVGKRPFVANNDFKLITAHVETPPMPPAFAAPDAQIPLDLERVVLRALEKKPERRFATARDMANALEHAAQSL